MVTSTNNLVGLSTYARRTGKHLEALRRYQRSRSDFPQPILAIEEINRTKQLWERPALDEYFAKIDQERLAKQELKLERAERKTARSILHW